MFDTVGDLFGAGVDIITGTVDTISNIGEDLLDVTAGAATEVGSAAVDVLETTGVIDVLDLAGSGCTNCNGRRCKTCRRRCNGRYVWSN